ncbi:hypothetical protein [Streptomyces adelaidensis]|uniref:hypothetical protein n=1 Tax=Streptomyces adelaidensis TaxID=2796465 RepID=UPI0019049D1D|nr:hypothetical protein [Streptomyces adelaidensis]
MPSRSAPAHRRESGSITFSPGILQHTLPLLLVGLIVAAVLYTGLAFTADPVGLGELWQWLSGMWTAAVLAPLLLRHDTVTLTETALVRGRGRRPIARTDIHRLEVRGLAGVRQIAVHTKDGKHFTLHTPMSLLDKEFDHKVQTLTRWWQTQD